MFTQVTKTIELNNRLIKQVFINWILIQLGSPSCQI